MASNFLQGRNICLAGRFVALTQNDLAQLIPALGGRFLPRPRRTNFLLVLGDDGWPAQADGSPPRAVRYAAKLQTLGYKIESLAEAEFFERLDLASASKTCGQFTLADLARILGASTARLRRWLRAGLIEPSATVHRLAYFDFHQVTNARRLCELVSSGTSLAAIRDGLEQLRRWLPDQNLPLEQLARLEHNGRLLLRLDDRLLDRSGQLHFDFGGQAAPGLTVPLSRTAPAADSDTLFDAALAAEDAGELVEAARLYEQVLAGDPHDPVLHFNYGNVLFGLGQYADACASYRAALTLDPQYAEAWNNLGNAHVQAEDFAAAETAFHRALALVPRFDIAHANLADLLERLGRDQAAAAHRRQYRQHRTPTPAECGAHWLRVVRADTSTDE